MKKILSILVCVLVGIMGVYAQKTYTSTMTLNVSTGTQFTPTSAGANATTHVCSSAISDDCNTTLAVKKTVSATVPKFSGLTDFAVWIGTFYLVDIPQTFTVYLSTEIDPAYSDQYVFSHWTDPDGKIIEGLGKQGTYTYQWMAQNSDAFERKSLFSTELRAKNPSKNITVKAHWVQPQVTNRAVTNCGEVTDPNVRPTNGTIEFTLNRDVEANNYIANTENLKENNFQVRNSAYSKGKYTYTISYDPTGIHGTYQATMSLCSKYPKGDVENKCQEAKISVKENYEPIFTANSAYDFGSVAKGSFRQTPSGYLSLSKSNYAANNAVWTAEIIPGANSDGLFAIQGDFSAQGEPIVRFTPAETTADGNYSATLRLKATYYDAASIPIGPAVKEVLLTASVYTAVESSIQFGSPKISELDFGAVVLGTASDKLIYMQMDHVLENAESPTFAWTDNDVFDYSYNAGNVTVSIRPEVTCGVYQSILTATAISSLDASTVNDVITVKVELYMATPILGGYSGIGKNTLVWNSIAGADGYIVYRDDVQVATITDTLYVDAGITSASTHSYKVEAVHDADQYYNTISNVVSISEGQPGIITENNATTTGIYTGTIHPTNNTFPYKLKYEVDLTRCFDVNNAAPLFDTLYVFGLTTNTSDGSEINTPSSSVGCNAKTMCYVYAKKIEIGGYEYKREFDAVATRIEHNETVNGKKLYFTGYCPFAYMGVNSTEEGWMYFKGANTSVDLYLDSCQIRGRYKTPSGKNGAYNNYTLTLEASLQNIFGGKENISIIKGVSAPFVFSSTTKNTGESYKPSIHIAGKNHLQGQLGSYIHGTIGDVQGIATVDAGLGSIYTYSAPIVIKPTEIGQYTDLVMDDIWPDGTITNGYLRLDSDKGGTSSEKVIAIDLGSEYGSLTINGGQYHMRNSAADGTYACNLAIGYRKFTKSVVYKDIPCTLGLYGFGGDMTDCNVTINAGTFTMYANMYPAKGGGWLGTDYYEDRTKFLDLRLPAGKNNSSRINGGTFNNISHVFMCSNVISTGTNPYNSKDFWLCLQDVEVNPAEQTPSGSVKFEIPEPFNDDEIYVTPKISYDLIEDGDVVATGNLYGGQSINPFVKEDGKSYVRLLLVGDACGEECGCVQLPEKIYHQWATAIPEFNVSKMIKNTIETISVGGEESVEIEDQGIGALHPTLQMLYVDLEGLTDYSYTLPNGAGLSFKNSNNDRGIFTNSLPYTIYENLNMFKVVQADTWYTFTAPYDVHEISVIETKESTISKKERPEAIELQAKDNLSVFYEIESFVIPNTEGRASSLTLPELLPSNGARLIPITHYDGTNIMSANYYIYELENEVFSTTGTGENLAITWKPVKRNTGEPLMYQGKTYAIQFPWCPMCNDDLNSRTDYDYWSNKMILFYGKGPQTIAGTNLHNTIVSEAMPTKDATATLAGNSTFAAMTLTAQTAYVHNTANDIFELNNEQYVVKPTEGFLLYNPGAMPMPARISRSGQIEYDENAETGVDGVPTVSDRTSLMLFGAYDGFEVLALHEQLVTVYNLQGNIIFQQYMTAGEQVYVPTGAGIYVVRGESEAIKVMIE